MATAARVRELANERINPLIKAMKRCNRVSSALADQTHSGAKLLDDAVSATWFGRSLEQNRTSAKRGKSTKALELAGEGICVKGITYERIGTIPGLEHL